MRIFENENYDESILPIDKFQIFLKINEKCHINDQEIIKHAVEDADKAMEQEIPQLYAHSYVRFLRDGNRNEYEKPHHDRRDILKALVWGEICSESGKYMEKIIDVLWLIMEESTWQIPAHNRVPHDIGRNHKPLPYVFDNDYGYIDLYAAMDASMLGFIYYFLGNRFEKSIRDIINQKILFSIRKRVIEPFVKYDDMSWMGFTGNEVNNWCTVIVSNILVATAFVEDNLRTRQLVVEKALKCLDNFVDGYAPDGGCSEGPGYWRGAGGALFDALETLYDMSGGKIDKFNEPIIRSIMDYIRKVNLSGKYYTCFADAQVCEFEPYKTIYRMGIKTNNKLLSDFAKNMIDKEFVKNNDLLKNLKDSLFAADYKAGEYLPNYVEYLPDLQVAVLRSERKSDAKFIVGIKGGHNNESHNHNDVGNFVVYTDGKPFIVDLGICTYTKALFDERRYTIFPTYSKAHNLPVINDKGEVEGIDYAATSFDVDEKLNTVKVSYKNAYENRDEINACEREISVFDDGVKICEKVELKEKGKCLFNYYLALKPELKDNIITFPNGAEICVTGCGVSVEDVILKDEKLKKAWDTDKLYKVIFTPMDSSGFFVEMTIKNM